MAPALKYIVRAIKYFFYFSIIMIVIMSILVLAHVVDGNIETMFRDGYNSLWEIGLMFAAVTAKSARPSSSTWSRKDTKSNTRKAKT